MHTHIPFTCFPLQFVLVEASFNKYVYSATYNFLCDKKSVKQYADFKREQKNAMRFIHIYITFCVCLSLAVWAQTFMSARLRALMCIICICTNRKDEYGVNIEEDRENVERM